VEDKRIDPLVQLSCRPVIIIDRSTYHVKSVIKDPWPIRTPANT
jgi:hypothetical protein